MTSAQEAKGENMNKEQAISILEQAVALAIRNCGKLEDQKAIMVAWETVAPALKGEENENK